LLTISVVAVGVTANPVSEAEPGWPAPPPPLVLFAPLHPIISRAHERIHILRLTVFPSARIQSRQTKSRFSEPRKAYGWETNQQRRQSGLRFYLV